jgi:4'-phosphopantetheinyl transferase EntD
MIQLMSSWRDDLSGCTLEEIIRRQAENREWSRELRCKFNSLVNSRLAKAISQAEYIAGRTLAHEDLDECQRRAAVLNALIVGRGV